MSLHPDILIQGRSAPIQPVSPLDATGFMTAVCERGPAAPTISTSLADWEALHGGVTADGDGHVAADAFFRAGGKKLVTRRVMGAAKATATLNLFDASGSVAPGDVSLVVSASSPGEWANGATGGLKVEVETGGVTSGYFVLIVKLNDVEVERSPELVDRDAAVAWGATSDYIRIALGASAEDPRDAAAASLAGGASDHAGIVEADWTAALAGLPLDLGPGFVAAPGHTTTAGHTALFEHAGANDRVAIADTANSAVVATLAGAGTAQRAAVDAPKGGVFGPWLTIEGTTSTTTRRCPASAVVMGMLCGAIANGASPGDAIAGEKRGQLPNFVLGARAGDPEYDPTQNAWAGDADDPTSDLNVLHSAGVNVIRRVGGKLQIMGYRTPADETTDEEWVDLAGVALLQRTSAQMRAMLRRNQFDKIDARGKFAKLLEGQGIAILQPYYRDDYLYGETEDEAFVVDAVNVNTPQTAAAREGHIAWAMKTSPTAERMIGNRIKVRTEGSVA